MQSEIFISHCICYRATTSQPKNINTPDICAGDGCYFIDRLLCQHLTHAGGAAADDDDGAKGTGESPSTSSSTPIKSKQERFVINVINIKLYMRFQLCYTNSLRAKVSFSWLFLDRILLNFNFNNFVLYQKRVLVGQHLW